MLNSDSRQLKLILAMVQLAMVITSCANEKPRTPTNIEASGYTIILADSAGQSEACEFLFHQLAHRCSDKRIVVAHKKEDGYKTIEIKVNATFAHDYCIDCGKERLVLQAKNLKTAKWLILQFVKHLSQADQRFIAGDLPPAVIPFKSGCYDFDFAYREPYFQPNSIEAHTDVLGTHMLEEDWGIWGHNVAKIIAAAGNDAVFAEVDGTINRGQFCFSSEETLQIIKEYILDYQSDKSNHSHRFMIAPADNTMACTCSKCKALGNTPHRATPAVSHIIKKLAGLFPQHTFFTIAYLTTQHPPAEKWPDNTGVMISTIDLPKGVPFNGQPGVKAFVQLQRSWKTVTDKIYIWDYAANFDDYLTPLPVLYALKDQLNFYKQQGITGVFLNASGYDYSPFDGVKTYVSAALMQDCSLPVDSLCSLYFSHYYPLAGEMLNDYYLSIEKEQQRSKKPYQMYAGFEQALHSYLDPGTFMSFYRYIEKMKDKARDDEKERLQKLFIALSFTRLQIGYYMVTGPHGFAIDKGKKLMMKKETKEVFGFLEGYKEYDDLYNYKEANGKIETYLNNWRRMFMKTSFQNLLMGEALVALSKPDEEYQNLHMLNNGVTGFEVDYHQGWFINSAPFLHVQFGTANVRSARRITLRFLVDERHRILAPVKLEIYKDGEIYKTITPQDKSYHILPSWVMVCEKIDLQDAGVISIKLFKSPAGKSMACDEIQLTD